MKPQVFSLGNVSREREKKIYEEQLDVLLSLWISHSTTYVGGILIFHLIPKCFVSSIVRYSHYAKKKCKMNFDNGSVYFDFEKVSTL